MKNAAWHLTATGDGVVEGVYGEMRLHPTVDRVTNDPLRVHVLDGAEVKPAFIAAVLGQVRKPQLVRGIRSEVPTNQIVMRWRRGLGGLAVAGLDKRRPPAIVPAELPYGPLAHQVAGVTNFIGEEPIAELGIVSAGVEDGVSQVCLVEPAVRARLTEPSVVLPAT